MSESETVVKSTIRFQWQEKEGSPMFDSGKIEIPVQEE
jgi:hypothetical protein